VDTKANKSPLLVEEAMYPAPEPSRSAPASQAVSETGRTAPHLPRPDDSGSDQPSVADMPRTLPPAGSDEVPAQLGRYLVEGEIGRGGMGVVYRVHDPALKRTLAVKVLQRHHQDNPDLNRRFLEEAELMAQLQHPGIAPLHDVGELPDGRPYFSMKLIRGRTLTQLLQERPSPTHDLPRFLAIFGQLCETIAYAHSRHILHRDLKPSNVMVGAFGEVQVMDWGLAKVLGSPPTSATGIQPDDSSAFAPVRTAGEDLATHAGAILGTPAYMAPEQARGEIERLDERADVFGLGAILCVLLTGKPPYVGSTKAEVYRQAKEAALTDAFARLEGSGADDDLVRLAKSCLTPDLAERPRQAGLVAEAVAAYQTQVQERLQQAEMARARAEVQAQEERKRRRVTLALAGAVLLLLLGVGAAGWWHQQQQAAQALHQERAEAEVKAALAETTQLRQRGLELLDQPEAWQATLATAGAALKRARTVLQQEESLAGTALAQQVADLEINLTDEEKDRRLVTAFEQVRFKLLRYDPRSYPESEAAAEVRGALAQWGLSLAALPVNRATALLQRRPRSMQDRLTALLHFCLSRVLPEQEKEQRQWLTEVLAAADPDPWRQQVRQAVTKGNGALLARLVDQADVAQQPPLVLVEVAWEPLLRNEPARVRLLRRAQQQYPSDFWANHDLGVALCDRAFPRGVVRAARGEELAVVSEAVGFFRVAVGLRPGSAPAHYNLGWALARRGDLPAAIACFRMALGLDPKYAPAHYSLGDALKAQGDVKGAIACYTKVIDLDPKVVPAYVDLGALLCDYRKDYGGAVAAFQKALDLEPKYVRAHHNLGVALSAQGDWKRAVASFRQALDLDPKYAPAYAGLGQALYAQGDQKGAIACLRKVRDLAPQDAKAHSNLGNALQAQGDLLGAIACYTKALKLDPKLSLTHYNLGLVLQAQGDVKGAIASYKKAIDLAPNYASAYGALGQALLAQGAFEEARAANQKALQLLPQGHPLRPHVTRLLQDCQRLLDLERRLPGLLAGDEQPKDAAEQLALGDLCRRYKKRYAAAARFYADAFAAGAAQSSQRAYNASCAAILAAAGKGEDAAKLDAQEKTRLREQALAWLTSALTILDKLVEDPERRKEVRQKLHHWQQDADLASVRGQEALAQLPEAERTAWQQLWAEVETLRQKTSEGTK
jgi:serine/threonine-protein kinase